MFPHGFQQTDGRMSPLAKLSGSSSAVSRCIVFLTAGQALALPVSSVRRFLPRPRLDHLPTAPPVVAGVFRYHGTIVPVLRLALLLDLGPGAGSGPGAGPGAAPSDGGLYAPLILMTWRGRPLALLVDQVDGAVAVADSELSPAEPALSFNGCAVAGFADPSGRQGGTVVLLDPDHLLNDAEARLLDAFRTAAERRLDLWHPGPLPGPVPEAGP